MDITLSHCHTQYEGSNHVPTWQIGKLGCSKVKELPLSREKLQLDPRFAWFFTFAFPQPPWYHPSEHQPFLHKGWAVVISRCLLSHSENPSHHHRAPGTSTAQVHEALKYPTCLRSANNPARSYGFSAGTPPCDIPPHWESNLKGHTWSASVSVRLSYPVSSF